LEAVKIGSDEVQYLK